MLDTKFGIRRPTRTSANLIFNGGVPLAVFSQATARMRSFLYRQPRFKTNVGMDLILGDQVILGACISISESGLRGNFSNPIAPPAEGLLTLYHLDQSFQVRALVETVRGDEARVSFRIASHLERECLRQFLKSLPGSPKIA